MVASVGRNNRLYFKFNQLRQNRCQTIEYYCYEYETVGISDEGRVLMLYGWSGPRVYVGFFRYR